VVAVSPCPWERHLKPYSKSKLELESNFA